MKKPLSRILSIVRDFKYIMIISIILTLLLALCRQVIIYLLGQMIDTVISDLSRFPWRIFYLFFGLILISVILSAARNFSSGIFANRSIYKIRTKTIFQMIPLPIIYFKSHPSGKLIGKINNSLGVIEKFLKQTFTNTVFHILTGLFASILGFILCWDMTLLILGVALLCAVIALKLSKPIHGYQKDLLKTEEEISSLAQDGVAGFREVKTFSLYDHFERKFDTLVDESVRTSRKISKLDCILEPVLLIVSFGMQVVIVIIGLYFIHLNKMTLGELVIFQQLQEILRRIFRIDFMDFRKASGAAEAITELWEEEPEKHEGSVTEGVAGSRLVSLNSISFSYTQNRETSLDNVSIDIEKGENLALVGASGSGKSTLLKIIAGYYFPHHGEYLYRGNNLENWDFRNFRDDISYVDQDIYLFPDSIFENIACGLYGRENTDNLALRVEEAAEKAGLLLFIRNLPEGFQTQVGERGIQLSGGERQRVGIARAFIKDSELLIMDEPTSALDAATEDSIQKSLAELMKNRTVIMAAHRLSTVKNSSRIVVLDHGQIKEIGTHNELIEKESHYRRLYNTQLGLEAGETL